MTEFEPDVKRLAASFSDGSGVIFAGAGVSATAGAPLWHDLTTSLAAQLRPKTTIADPILVAQFFRNAYGEHQLVTEVRRRLARPQLRPSRCHDVLAALPVRVFVTTNYDNLLETALRQRGCQSHIVCDDHDLALWDERAEVQVVKLHGDLDRAGSLIISEADYAELLNTNSGLQRKLTDLFWHRPVLFVGYSMHDPDIAAIYHGVVQAAGKLKRSAYILTFETDIHVMREWRRRNIDVFALRPSRRETKTECLERFLTELRQEIVNQRRDHECDVLIVEDDLAITELLSMVTARVAPHIIVGRAANGLKASVIMARTPPRLLMLDLVMPEMDGFELLDLMKSDAALANVKVIIVSANLNSATLPRLQAYDLFEIVPKPFDMQRLVASIRRALGMDPSAPLPWSA